MDITTDPQGHQDRQPSAAGQDEVENTDHYDNLQDADTVADLSDPAIDSAGLDDQPDGDRQLTTDSGAIDGGLNDSDLGAEAAGLPSNPAVEEGGRKGFADLGADTPQTGGGHTGDRATGLTDLRG